MSPFSDTDSVATPSLFGRVRMGYGVIESKRLDGWKHLLDDAFGMDVNPVGKDVLRCRLDERDCRFLVRSGEAEDFVALGIELDDEACFEVLTRRLAVLGIAPECRSGEEAALRGVKRFWRFRGPKGLTVELFYEPVVAKAGPRIRCGGFVTGELGFGHAAITTREPERMQAFWQQVFDMRYSDEVHQKISGVPLDFTFLRFNPRHHSIALASTPKIRLDPMRTQVQHLEVQVASLDDVGAAYRRCHELKIPVSMAVGQHANDKALSFYALTPSGFDWEYGWNPIRVDEATWKPDVWDRVSDWGHFPEGVTTMDVLGRLGRGVASLGRKEFVPAHSQIEHNLSRP